MAGTNLSEHSPASERVTLFRKLIEMGSFNDFVPHEAVISPRLIVGNNKKGHWVFLGLAGSADDFLSEERKETGNCLATVAWGVFI